jgi:hypothetical protein
VAKAGLSNKNAKKVSAIIFPLNGISLYPANARGLLQVAKEMEDRRDIQTQLTKRLLDGKNTLGPTELQDLAETSIQSYKLSSFTDKFQHYCEIAHELACSGSTYSVQAYIGKISSDWHPLGFSQNPRSDRCNLPISEYCKFKDWNAAWKDFNNQFGSRAFLIRNLEVKNIPGRILIDFDKPSEQLIPDIGRH